MIHLFYMKVTALYQEAVFKKYCGRVDQERLSKVLRTGLKESQVRSLAAGILVNEGVEQFAGGAAELNDISYFYGSGGKPYFKDFPSLFFNISHSSDYAACAFSDCEVGLDLQNYTEVNMKLVERFFHEEDIRLLKADQEFTEAGRIKTVKHALFTRMWSVKESYIKLTGEGMKQGLDSFLIDWDKSRIHKLKTDVACDKGKDQEADAYFEEADIIPGYACFVCSAGEINKVFVREIVI